VLALTQSAEGWASSLLLLSVLAVPMVTSCPAIKGYTSLVKAYVPGSAIVVLKQSPAFRGPEVATTSFVLLLMTEICCCSV
jgi:hypothetical protein